MFEYKTKGTCSTKIKFEINEGRVHNISFEDGCDGNLKAIAILAEGMDANDLVSKLKGNRCDDKPTSCGDQLAQAVEKYIGH
jgi:uncharacterized protein (TIGR03905 family)